MIKEEAFARIKEIQKELELVIAELGKYGASADEIAELPDDKYEEAMAHVSAMQQKAQNLMSEIERLEMLIHPGEN